MNNMITSSNSNNNKKRNNNIISTTKTATKLFSSLTFQNDKNNNSNNKSSNNNNSNDDDDLDKWQKMYDENTPSSTLFTSPQSQSPSSSSPSSTKKSEIRVVTFDLDNTLWKTNNVISTANDILNKHLQDNGVHVPTRVEKIMNVLFQQNKMKYSPILVDEALNQHGYNYDVDNVDNVDNDVIMDSTTCSTTNSTKYDDEMKKILEKVKTPVLLTQLRIDALKEVYKNQTQHITNSSTTSKDTEQQPQQLYNDDDDQIDQLAKEAFDIWTQARHDAIPHNLANSVIECLNQIRSLKTSYGEKVVIGAITDGNSDPRRVDMLKDYFDFCVNAESVGISKPDRRIYDAAMVHVYSNKELQHVFLKGEGVYHVDFGLSIDEIDCDSLFDIMEDKWVHIGDDFLKDIVGAKELKMRSVWSTELVKHKLQANSQSNESTKSNDKNDKDDIEERQSKLDKELTEKKVVKMIIGSEDFLLESLQSEFADEIVHEFIDVGRVITEWHMEGLASTNDHDHENNNDDDDDDEMIISQEVKDLFTIVVPDDKDVIEACTETTSSSNDMKFCIMCGTKLPKIAKFCSACGNKL